MILKICYKFFWIAKQAIMETVPYLQTYSERSLECWLKNKQAVRSSNGFFSSVSFLGLRAI
jgi:hypothetical protein